MKSGAHKKKTKINWNDTIFKRKPESGGIFYIEVSYLKRDVSISKGARNEEFEKKTLSTFKSIYTKFCIDDL